MKQRIEAKEEIYLILAEFFKFPTEEFYQEVKKGEIEERLKVLFQEAGFNPLETQFQNLVDTFNNMKQNYMHCFMGVTKPYAPPVESVYKVWTTDPTAEISIAKSKGYFYGDAALHIRHLFEQFQIEVPDEYKNMPDHLTLELEFLAYLIKSDTRDFARQFILDHLDWLNDFRRELKPLENSQLYVEVTNVIISTIKSELKGLEEAV